MTDPETDGPPTGDVDAPTRMDDSTPYLRLAGPGTAVLRSRARGPSSGGRVRTAGRDPGVPSVDGARPCRPSWPSPIRGNPLTDSARTVERTYLVLTLLTTLASSFI